MIHSEPAYIPFGWLKAYIDVRHSGRQRRSRAAPATPASFWRSETTWQIIRPPDGSSSLQYILCPRSTFANCS